MSTPQLWEAKQGELEDAFRRLKIINKGEAEGIPYGYIIPDIARELMLMAPTEVQRKEAAKKSLKELRSATGRLINVLDQLSPTVVNSLNFRATKLRSLHTTLRILHAAAKMTDVRGRRGAPPKDQAAIIRDRVEQHYYYLTGKKGTVSTRQVKAKWTMRTTPGGDFFELLTTVYRVLGIDASAEAQLKSARRPRRLLQNGGSPV